ncbi:MAG: ATP-binding protein [Spirochaetaceae bacterium]|nr:MAG: ATP-binding protein [Spirochaetaceae bacterium]
MIPRTLAAQVEKSRNTFPILSITGPRQAGKTTLVQDLFSEYGYFNLEALDVRSIAETDPRRFIMDHIERGMVLDEAQRVPALFNYLQPIVDESRLMGKVVLTGSQHFLLLESVTQSLAGRVMLHELLPFTVRELPHALSERIDHILFRGMYPPLHDREIDPLQFYPTYIQTYVERDVRLVRNIGDLSAFSRFLRLCAGRIGGLLNMSSLAVEAGIDHKTVRSWLSVLEASFIVFFLQPYHRNFNKRLVKQPKLYFYDTGLACSLLGLDAEDRLFSHYLRGGIFENFVVAELRKMRLHRGSRPAMYFWRDNSGTEVDLIVERAGEISAVEIKSGATFNDEWSRSLEKFGKYSGVDTNRRHIVYGGDSSFAGSRIWSWRDMLALDELL